MHVSGVPAYNIHKHVGGEVSIALPAYDDIHDIICLSQKRTFSDQLHIQVLWGEEKKSLVHTVHAFNKPHEH